MSATGIILFGGSGRLGSAIRDQIERDPETELIASIGRDTVFEMETALPSTPVVVLDVSSPAGTMDALSLALPRQIPFITGVTGHSPDQRDRIGEAAGTIPVLVAANFSLGITVLLEVLPFLVGAFPDADLAITEVHHRAKRDAPSGTALRLRAAMAASDCQESDQTEIPVFSIRGGTNPGEHTVLIAGTGEELQVTHRTIDRSAYAAGALGAAKWLSHRPNGAYEMTDLIGLARSGARSRSGNDYGPVVL